MSHTDPSRTMDLLLRARQGDRWSLNEIFRRYYPRLLGLVRHRLGGKIRQDVESCDIVQDSLMVAARKLSGFEMRSRTSLINWLGAIVENQIRDRATWQNAECRRRSSEACQACVGQVLSARESQDAQSPLEQLLTKERAEAVGKHLAQLAPRYRDLIRSRHHEELEWDEIAERNGRPTGNAARMMYHEALTKLRVLLRRQRSTG